MQPATKNLIGLKFTACHLVPNASESEYGLDCGAVLHPFKNYSENSQSVHSRSPILCMSCGGFLSVYALLNELTGEWRCPFCQSVNPRFFPDTGSKFPVDIFPELQSRHCDYAVSGCDDGQPTFMELVDPDPSFVFVIDCHLGLDEDFPINLFYGIKQLPATSMVSIVLFDNVLSAVRLCGNIAGTLVIDAIHNCTDPGLFDKLIQHGTYATSAENVCRYFESIRSAIVGLIDRNTASPAAKCTLNTIINFSLQLDNARKSSNYNGGTRIVLLTTRSLVVSSVPLGGKRSVNAVKLPANLNSVDERCLTKYHKLGRYAFLHGCWIDVFCCGLKDINVDKLDALVCASSGMLVQGPSFKDEALRKAFLFLLSEPSLFQMSPNSLPGSEAVSAAGQETFYRHFQSGDRVATVEVRTCGHIAVDRIIGPVVPVHDTLWYRAHAHQDKAPSTEGRSLSQLTAADLAVDANQLSYSIANAEQCTRNFNINKYCGDFSTANKSLLSKFSMRHAAGQHSPKGSSTPSAEAIEGIYKEICRHNEEKTIVAGISSRFQPDTAITLSFRPVMQSGGKHGDQSVSSTMSTVVAKAFQPFQPSLRQMRKTSSGTFYDASDERQGTADYHGMCELESRAEGAYVQLVVRFKVMNLQRCEAPRSVALFQTVRDETVQTDHIQQSSGTSKNQFRVVGTTTVTRVWTYRLEITSDVAELVSGVDEHLYGFVLCRGLVADYHGEVVNLFGGARRSKLDEQGKYGYSQLQELTKTLIRDVTKNIAAHWQLNHNCRHKMLSVFRMLYALKEGPLLDGPAMSAQEAYILRSLFLMSTLQQAMRILLPSVTLGYVEEKLSVAAPPEGGVVCNIVLHDLPPEAMSLLPNTVAMVDFGDIIIIRANPVLPSATNAVRDALRIVASYLEDMAHMVAPSRIHTSHRIKVLCAGTADDRILFSRLSPNHMTLPENLLELMAMFKEKLVSHRYAVELNRVLKAAMLAMERIRAERPPGELLSWVDICDPDAIKLAQQSAPITEQEYFFQFVWKSVPAIAPDLLSRQRLLAEIYSFQGWASHDIEVEQPELLVPEPQVIEREETTPPPRLLETVSPSPATKDNDTTVWKDMSSLVSNFTSFVGLGGSGTNRAEENHVASKLENV